MSHPTDFLLAIAGAAVAWTVWGTLTSGLGWHDLEPGEALRSTFSLRFWRTGSRLAPE